MSVEAYLVSKGIDNGRIYSAAFGPAHLRAASAEPTRRDRGSAVGLLHEADLQL